MQIAKLENIDEFQKVFELIEIEGKNLFITGKAGTGKSTFLNYLRKNTEKNYAVLAPTGVAALNVRGQTIHSFFKFKPQLLNLSQIKVVGKNDLYKKLDLLIIDEISMVRADLFDAIEKFLSLNGKKPGTPFGGVQICVIGDLFQLPPVVTYNERDIYNQRYESPFFFAAKTFSSANFRIYELEKIYRQHNLDFINALNNIRIGKVSNEVLAQINSRYIGDNDNNLKSSNPGSIVITANNILAESVNKNELEKLNKESFVFSADIKGDFAPKDDKLPAPKELQLKLGAQVMFVRNDPKKRWVNGTIGVISYLSPRCIEVRIQSGNKEKFYEVEKELWENVVYNYDETQDKIAEKITGSYRQFPLVHAWAITIHKSQGKTLDNIIIDLGSGAFASGQVYVALSRCPSLEGITLRQKIKFSDIRSDFKVSQFYQQYKSKISYTAIS